MTKIVETDDLNGIKNALAFLVKREMYRDISDAHCNEMNQHFGTIEKADAAVKKVEEKYKVLLDGLRNE